MGGYNRSKIFSSHTHSAKSPTNPPLPTHTPRLARSIIFKIEWFPVWVRRKASTQNEVGQFNILWDSLQKDRHPPPPTHTHHHHHHHADTQIQSKKPRGGV